MDISNCPFCGAENYPNAQNCVICQSEINRPPISVAPRFGASKGVLNNQEPIRPLRYETPRNRLEAGAQKISLVFKFVLLLVVFGVGGFIYAHFFSIDKVSAMSAFDKYYYRVNPPTHDEIKSAILNQQASLSTPSSPTAPVPEKFPTAVEACEIESSWIDTDKNGRIVYSAKYKASLKLQSTFVMNEQNTFGRALDTYDSHRRVEGGFILFWNKYAKIWEKPENQKK